MKKFIKEKYDETRKLTFSPKNKNKKLVTISIFIFDKIDIIKTKQDTTILTEVNIRNDI